MKRGSTLLYALFILVAVTTPVLALWTEPRPFGHSAQPQTSSAETFLPLLFSGAQPAASPTPVGPDLSASSKSAAPQVIDWYDEIIIRPGQRAGIELICEGPCWAPAGADNLVYKAAALLLENCHYDVNVSITLRKNIPAGTGLGSASSDAAAALMGLKH